jgi:hypothetical protein
MSKKPVKAFSMDLVGGLMDIIISPALLTLNAVTTMQGFEDAFAQLDQLVQSIAFKVIEGEDIIFFIHIEGEQPVRLKVNRDPFEIMFRHSENTKLKTKVKRLKGYKRGMRFICRLPPRLRRRACRMMTKSILKRLFYYSAITSDEIDKEKMAGVWIRPEAIPVAFQGIDSLISLLKEKDMLNIRLPLFFEDPDRVREWIQSMSTAQPLLILMFEALAQPEIKAASLEAKAALPTTVDEILKKHGYVHHISGGERVA